MAFKVVDVFFLDKVKVSQLGNMPFEAKTMEDVMNLKSMAISVVMLGFVLLSFPSSGWALYGSFWEFTTDTEYFSGDYVDVFLDPTGEIINLDTSSTQEVPGVLISLDDPIRSLWGSPLPGNVGITSMMAFKTLQDSWMFPSSPTIQIYYLNAFYFGATVSGVAMRYNPVTFLTFENFTLNIIGWMHYEYSGESFGIDESECEQDCWDDYISCYNRCGSLVEPEPIVVCQRACHSDYVSCLTDCRNN